MSIGAAAEGLSPPQHLEGPGGANAGGRLRNTVTDTPDSPNRRAFLKGLGTIGATGAIVSTGADVTAEPQAAAPPAAPARTPAQPPVSHAYTFFSAPESAFIEAAVDRLIPADDLTPGGTDCGVAIFIDRQLSGAWARATACTCRVRGRREIGRAHV